MVLGRFLVWMCWVFGGLLAFSTIILYFQKHKMEKNTFNISLPNFLHGIDVEGNEVSTNNLKIKEFDNAKLCRLLYHSSKITEKIDKSFFYYEKKKIGYQAEKYNLNKDFKKQTIDVINLISGFKPHDITEDELKIILKNILESNKCLREGFKSVHHSHFMLGWLLLYEIVFESHLYLYADKKYDYIKDSNLSKKDVYVNIIQELDECGHDRLGLHGNQKEAKSGKNKKTLKYSKANSGVSLFSQFFQFFFQKEPTFYGSQEKVEDSKIKKELREDKSTKPGLNEDRPEKLIEVSKTALIIYLGVDLSAAYIVYTDPRFQIMLKFISDIRKM